MTALGHPEVEDLLGAYALDALEADEADAVDLHLRDCPRCRAEVADFREAASLLAFGGVEAPPGVWEKIQASLEEAPPQLELARVVPIRTSRWQTMGAKVAAAAAVIISVAALAISLTGAGRSDGSGAGELADVVRNAATDPDGLPVHLAAARSGGAGAADIVILDGRAYLVRHSLPTLPPGETYQLWGQKGETVVSLGVLGPEPQQTILPAGAAYDALAITAEKSPGVVTSQNPAVVAGLVPVD
jgi:anti-sigma-K factor RskA